MSSSAISAGETRLGELLIRFQDSGLSLVYTTALVDESLVVDWNGDISVSVLRRILLPHGLTLESIDRTTWAIIEIEPGLSEQGIDDLEPIDLKSIENIIVTASRYQLRGDDGTSTYLIGETRLNDTPSFAGDSLRIVHRLPGAASIGVTAKPNVRGGSDDELLVLFDGVELVEPFHLRDFQSMFSSFNPQTIQSVEFFTGGFPAKYGNRMSGVLDIATQDAFAAPGGELGISAYSLSGLYYTETDKGRWLISARRGNLDVVLKSELGDPKYHDFYSRYSREIDGGTLKASVFLFDDDILFTDDENRTESDVENRYVWFEWEREPGEDNYSRTILSFGQVDSLREGWTFAEEDTEGMLFDKRLLDIASIKHMHELKLTEKLKLDFGVSFRHQSMEYDTRVVVEKYTKALFLRLPTIVSFKFAEKFSGNSLGIFGTAKYKPTDRLAVELGLRYDRQDYALESESQVSPRLAMRYKLTDDWDVRFIYGRFHQPQAIHELKTADQETFFFAPQKSDHYIAATEYRVNKNDRIVAEIFFKQVDDLKPRHINLFDPYVYLPELAQDRYTILADEAESKGFELSYLGGSDVFEWHLNYTYSEVRDKENGRWIDRRWDQTHNFNALLNWTLGNWSFGLAAAWHTGWTTMKLPQEFPADEEFLISDYRSNDRLREYATLDVKVSYQQELNLSSLNYFLEVTNILSRANKGGVDYEIGLEDDVFELEEFDLQPIFPLVANIGVIWRF